jgi:hypothetical protein
VLFLPPIHLLSPGRCFTLLSYGHFSIEEAETASRAAAVAHSAFAHRLLLCAEPLRRARVRISHPGMSLEWPAGAPSGLIAPRRVTILRQSRRLSGLEPPQRGLAGLRTAPTFGLRTIPCAGSATPLLSLVHSSTRCTRLRRRPFGKAPAAARPHATVPLPADWRKRLSELSNFESLPGRAGGLPFELSSQACHAGNTNVTPSYSATAASYGPDQ